MVVKGTQYTTGDFVYYKTNTKKKTPMSYQIGLISDIKVHSNSDKVL